MLYYGQKNPDGCAFLLHWPQAYEKIDEKTSTVIVRPISKFFCHIFLQQVTRGYKSEDEIW